LEAEKNNLIREMQSTISNMANEIKDLKLTANWRSTLSALRKTRGLQEGETYF